jgi:uncharacterized ferritin-like protein (DUF455 family)
VNSLFKELETILKSDKLEKTQQIQPLLDHLRSGNLSINHEEKILPVITPTYERMTTIVTPNNVKKRRSLKTVHGKAIFLHAVTHIEFAAIDLALDATYRFRNLPLQYYIDWLEVAQDEVRHFLMLESLLNEMGYEYGDFPVHEGLFDAAKRSLNLIDRMAVVPRYLEANGLDANPKMIEKLQKVQGEYSVEICDALKIILNEEIEHVTKGDKWFTYACKQANVSKEIYFETIERIIPGSSKKRANINVEARKQAGFSCVEIKHFHKDAVCD